MGAPSSPDGVRSVISAVWSLAEPLTTAAGLVLEDVTLTPAGRRRVLRIVVDLPETQTGGVPMDAVAEASREISAALDSGQAMGAVPYVLEVSSPGADRPLTQHRHWLRARDRLVRLDAAGGAPQTGRLTAVDDDGVELDGEHRWPWEQVRSGRVELDFSRPVADEDADAAGEG